MKTLKKEFVRRASSQPIHISHVAGDSCPKTATPLLPMKEVVSNPRPI